MGAPRKFAWLFAGIAAVSGIAVFLRPGAAPAERSWTDRPGDEAASRAARDTAPEVGPAAAAPDASDLAPVPSMPAWDRRGAEAGPRGRVLDSATGEGLPGVTVRLGSAFDTFA